MDIKPFDYQADAARAIDAVMSGGIAIIPTTVGYVILAATTQAINRIIEVKRRAPSKLNAMIGCQALHDELHDLGDLPRRAVAMITGGYDLPVGAVAPAHLDHAMLSGLEAGVLERTTHDGTVAMLMNAGPLMDIMARMRHARAAPVIGSSANLTLHGTKFRVADIEPEVLAAADVVIDYGLMRWSNYGKSSTMINFADFSVVRHGSCFDLITDALRRHFDIELTEAAE